MNDKLTFEQWFENCRGHICASNEELDELKADGLVEPEDFETLKGYDKVARLIFEKRLSKGEYMNHTQAPETDKAIQCPHNNPAHDSGGMYPYCFAARPAKRN